MYVTFTWAAHPSLSSAIASSLRFLRQCEQTEAAQIDEHPRLEQILRCHRQAAPPAVAAGKKRGNDVRQRPDVKAHHQRGRPLFYGQASAEGLRCRAPHG